MDSQARDRSRPSSRLAVRRGITSAGSSATTGLRSAVAPATGFGGWSTSPPAAPVAGRKRGVRGGAAPRQPPQGTHGVWPHGVSWLVSHNHADPCLICTTGSRGRPGLLSARRGERSHAPRGHKEAGEGAVPPRPRQVPCRKRARIAGDGFAAMADCRFADRHRAAVGANGDGFGRWPSFSAAPTPAWKRKGGPGERRHAPVVPSVEGTLSRAVGDVAPGSPLPHSYLIWFTFAAPGCSRLTKSRRQYCPIRFSAPSSRSCMMCMANISTADCRRASRVV